MIIIREYEEKDISEMTMIWNEVVKDGVAFPQEDELSEETGKEFFGLQSYTGVAENDGEIVGLVYSASKQCRQVRTYLQCQLCGKFHVPRTAYRRKIG